MAEGEKAEISASCGTDSTTSGKDRISVMCQCRTDIRSIAMPSMMCFRNDTG